MKIKVQTCWTGRSDNFVFRALVCGGLLVQTTDGEWDRKSATEMLDLLEIHGYERSKIRFTHV